MPTYQRPGVYISETLQPITNPSTSTSDSIAAFVGTSAGGGPIQPTLVTSWAQYQALYGDIRLTQDALGFAAYSFFANGGSQCYISRAVNSGAVAASASFSDQIAGMNLVAPTLNAPSLAPSLAAPAIGTATASATGGTLAAGTYYYVVTAINANGETVKSQEVSATTTGSTSSVAITWTAVTGATGYKIYKGTAAAGESSYFSVGAVTTFTDTGAAGTAGTPPTVNSTAGGNLSSGNYYYVVTALNANGETIGSNEVSITVAANTTSKVTLTWGAVTGATKYKVYRGATAGNESTYWTVNAGTTYVDNGTAGTAGTVPTTNSASVPSQVEPVLQISALSPGSWASTVGGTSQVFITINPVADGNFDLIVDVGPNGTTAHEVFADVSLNPLSTRYVVAVVNSPTIGSKYVSATNVSTAGQVFGNDYSNPAAATAVSLVGGSDGTGTPNMVAAAQNLGTITSNLTLNVPGWSVVSDLNAIIAWINNTAPNIFLVADVPAPNAGDSAATVAAAAQTFVGSSGLTASSHVAVYGPWVYIQDPSTNVAGATRLVAPSGAVLGQYARNDVLRGVQHAPAGTGTLLAGVISAYCQFDGPTQDALNTAGVNVLRSVPGNVGVFIMGARTLAKATPDRYINIRRTLMYLEKSILNITNNFLFEQNTETVWSSISSLLNQFLTNQYQLGVLSGSSASTAYSVVCDSTINTPQAVAAGQMNVQVGVSLGTPAEYIVINIGQINGSTSVTYTTN